MAFWKQKYNQTEGFSLIEVMVSIAILGFVAVPMFTGLLFSYRLNKRSDEKLLAQLAVSSAVETIMAEGFNEDWYDEDAENPDEFYYHKRFPNVAVKWHESTSDSAYHFTVKARNLSPSAEENTFYDDVYVTTYARPYKVPTSSGGGETT